MEADKNEPLRRAFSSVRIGDRLIGPGQACFIVAEAGVNHNGDIRLAYRLIDLAARAGVNAVKFQSFVTEELVTPEAPKPGYQLKTTPKADSQFKMIKALELNSDDHAKLKAHCEKSGVIYLCTPYDKISLDKLDRMDVAAFKVSSTDTTNIPFLRYIAAKGRPVILSTGMSTFDEVKEALCALYSGGLTGRVILLHCTSEYPAPVSEVNLRAISSMHQAFGCPVGFSDHTAGIGAGLWAVVAGACVIEKHFSLDRDMAGPDHRASIGPDELSELVKRVRDAERALGDGVKRPMPSELPNKTLMQRSLVAKRNIRAGEIIKADDLTCKRPGSGLRPSCFDCVVGKQAATDIPKDGVLTFSSIKWKEPSSSEVARE